MTDRYLKKLADKGLGLNDSQARALKRSLTTRLSLIWGPPGTGKSHTLKATLLAAMMSRKVGGIRILITAFTWTALDNVMVELIRSVPDFFDPGEVRFARVRSEMGKPGAYPELETCDLPLNRGKPSEDILALKRALTGPQVLGQPRITVVGSTAHQVSNLIRTGWSDRAVEELFDLIVIDEGSQMDVENAIVALASLAKNGSVIVAGDPLQLSPIHPALPPQGLEHMVGSIYGFLHSHHGVEPTALSVNYRSNAAIVRFCCNAGYDPSLRANSPDLRIRLAPPLPIDRPTDWPAGLPWSGEWKAILDPSHPLTCFVYPDGVSSQWNEFEAQAVAAMVWLLAEHMLAGCSGALQHDGFTAKPPKEGRYTPTEFWQKGVGIVTPHRAQQGLVVAKLEKMFSGMPGHDRAAMLGAVDTVERFQGQERDIIFATFALGDPDMISGEDAFLFSLNRFNVLASRAKAKLVVLMSSEVVDHLPNDLDVLKESRLLKSFAEKACPVRRDINLPWIDEQGCEQCISGSLRYLDASSPGGGSMRPFSVPKPMPPSARPVKPAEPAQGSLDSLDDETWGHIA